MAEMMKQWGGRDIPQYANYGRKIYTIILRGDIHNILCFALAHRLFYR